jgi:bacillithiol system protein YtxJ
MGLFSSNQKTTFPWQKLESVEQLNALISASTDKPTLVFKHSTRCSISVMVINKFEKQFNSELATCYYLDLLNHRDVSNEIANLTGIEHQSPQVVVWTNGKPVYHASHNGIDADAITSTIKQA